MRKFFIMCLIAVGMMFSSCTKQRGSYYVRYEVEAINNNGYGTSANIEFLTDETLISKTINGRFEEVYGPYSYNDSAYLKISCNHGSYSWNTTQISGKIYVSKNEEPFVLKSEIHTGLGGSSNTDTCEISYTIDF